MIGVFCASRKKCYEIFRNFDLEDPNKITKKYIPYAEKFIVEYPDKIYRILYVGCSTVGLVFQKIYVDKNLTEDYLWTVVYPSYRPDNDNENIVWF